MLLKQWKREMFAALLAVGLEPGMGNVRSGKGLRDVTIFHQSAVSL